MILSERLKISLCWVALIIYILCGPVQAETNRLSASKQDDLLGQTNNFTLAKTVFANSGVQADEIKLEVRAKINGSKSFELLGLHELCSRGVWSIAETGVFVIIKYVTTDVRCAAEAYEKLTLLLQNMESHEPVGVTFRGSINGELNSLLQHKTAQSLAKCVQAVYVEGINELNMNSSSFYTGLAKKYLLINKKRIDLNIASRYDKKNHATNLYVGSPLIYQDY